MNLVKPGFLLFLSFFIFTAEVSAQKNFQKEADVALEKGYYFEAIELYKKAYAKEKNRAKKAEIIFNIAEGYRNLLDYKQAEVWYQKAIRAKYPDPVAQLYLGDALKFQGKYEEAIVEYNNYKALAPGDKRAEDGIKSSEMAKKWLEEPTRYEVNNESQLNSKFYDYSPTFADRRNNTLIFTSQREGSTGNGLDDVIGENFSDLYESKRDKNGKWSTPVIVAGEVNTESNEGVAAVNRRGNVMYFTRCVVDKKEVFGCNLYQAKKTGNSWSSVEKFNIGNDTLVLGHPAMDPEDNFIIFTSDMEGGQGGKDLWMTSYDRRSKGWTTPINLGPEINTPNDEMFPFIREDGTLYFASNGHLGMGGLDIFSAEKKGEQKWGNVTNMKAPINSAADDYGIIFEGNDDRGFFTSNRDGGKGGDDIWNFAMPPLLFVLQGNITDVDSKAPIPGAVVTLAGSDGTSSEVTADATGFYSFSANGDLRYLNPNTTYDITVSATDYLRGKGKESTVGFMESTTFVKDFALQSIKKNEIRFPEVLYDLGSYTLREESKDSLNFLYQTLVDNPNIVIELSAHTDSRGSNKSNQVLSEKRAKSCVDYLVSKGIPSERMIPKGYGESRLLVTDAQIAKMKTVEEKEAGHQKNRRTVFKVLRTDYVPKGGMPEGPDAPDTQSNTTPAGETEGSAN